MKKYIYSIIALAALFMISCSNDEIDIATSDPVIKDAASVNVPLSEFFQSYSYVDTNHDISIPETYRTFNSESNRYILYMTLYYDKSTGVFKKGIFGRTKDTNSKVVKADLPEGNYYVITTVSFSTVASGELSSKTDYWSLTNRDNIRTARMVVNESESEWAILSVAYNEITVTKGKQVSINASIQPVGALCYYYLQNFQYRDESNTSAASDNGIRKLALYTQKKATSYNLDPNATSKFNYMSDSGENFWYYLSNNTPDMFNDNWTFFKSNLYGFCYILAPSCNLCFGYTPEGSETFYQYGESTYNIQSGKVYLAYWDWFQVGNPYFGIADNNHWNSYPTSTRAAEGSGALKPRYVDSSTKTAFATEKR